MGWLPSPLSCWSTFTFWFSTHSSTVGGSMHRVHLQTTNKHRQRRRNQSRPQSGHIHLCSLQLTFVSLHRLRIHTSCKLWRTMTNFFLLQHLLCSTEDAMEVEQPTSLFGHDCVHTSRKLCLRPPYQSDPGTVWEILIK